AALWSALDELARRDGTTVAFTTHLLDEADRASRVAILDRGRIVAIGAPERLKAEIGRQVLQVGPLPAEGDGGGLRADIERMTGCAARASGGRILVDAPDGARLVPVLADAFGGRIAAITLARPTLFDVFLHRTGRGFEAGEAAAWPGQGDAA